VRLAFSLLSILPMGAPPIGRHGAGRAMAAAPLVGAVLGLLAGSAGLAAETAGLSGLVCASLVLAAMAVLTRALHLDGLADTADALGSARPAAAALEVMKRSDIGPFGVAAVMIVLLIQAAALSEAFSAGVGVSAAVAAAATGRLVLPVACRRGVPAARPQGLGALVAGTVALPLGALIVLLGALASGLFVHLDGGPWWAGPVAALLAVALAYAAERHVVRRLGGITGDVLGALVELATTAALLVLAAAA
jgi:adenosylcobinamide-GDP ribazoletransferase